MKTNRSIFWVLIIILLVTNGFILLHRNEGYKYFPYKTYSQLYVTDSTLYLKDLHFDNDTVALSFSLNLPSRRYILTIDDSTVSKSIVPVNNLLRLPLTPNFHIYKLVPKDKGEMEIVVQADHSKNESGYTNEFIYCNLPGPQIKASPYKTWTKGIESFSKAEIQQGRSFLGKNTKALSATTDPSRLIEVCRLISALRPNANGLKASVVSQLQPYSQLQLATQYKVNLDCGNYSALIYFLCSILNIPNRVVTFAGPDGNWRYGVHYYNEVYLREKQQWVLCDGVSNGYMPHDSMRFYNAADVNKLAHTNGFKGKFIYTFRQDSLVKMNYEDLNYWHSYYNRNNANLCYLHPGTSTQINKWKYLFDFYSFDRDYDFYSDENANDWLKIIIKMTLFYLLAILVFWYAFLEIKNFGKPYKQRIRK